LHSHGKQDAYATRVCIVMASKMLTLQEFDEILICKLDEF